MLNDTVFMIRDGTFGSGFEQKLIFSLIAVGLCFIDWCENNKRKDYFWVFLFGTIIWTAAEFLQQLSGVREMDAGTLWGLQIPLFFSLILQGAFEGAFIAIWGLFAADRLISRDKRKKIIGIITWSGYTIYAVIGTLFQMKSAKDVGGDVASRRNMLAPMAIIFLVSILALDIIWMWRCGNNTKRKRILVFYLSMMIFAAIWTMSEFIANTRWIEVGIIISSTRAEPFVEFLALTWDVTVEIAAAYVPFLIIPYILKLVSNQSIEKIEEKKEI